MNHTKTGFRWPFSGPPGDVLVGPFQCRQEPDAGTWDWFSWALFRGRQEPYSFALSRAARRWTPGPGESCSSDLMSSDIVWVTSHWLNVQLHYPSHIRMTLCSMTLFEPCSNDLMLSVIIQGIPSDIVWVTSHWLNVHLYYLSHVWMT